MSRHCGRGRKNQENVLLDGEEARGKRGQDARFGGRKEENPYLILPFQRFGAIFEAPEEEKRPRKAEQAELKTSLPRRALLVLSPLSSLVINSIPHAHLSRKAVCVTPYRLTALLPISASWVPSFTKLCWTSGCCGGERRSAKCPDQECDQPTCRVGSQDSSRILSLCARLRNSSARLDKTASLDHSLRCSQRPRKPLESSSRLRMCVSASTRTPCMPAARWIALPNCSIAKSTSWTRLAGASCPRRSSLLASAKAVSRRCCKAIRCAARRARICSSAWRRLCSSWSCWTRCSSQIWAMRGSFSRGTLGGIVGDLEGVKNGRGEVGSQESSHTKMAR